MSLLASMFWLGSRSELNVGFASLLWDPDPQRDAVLDAAATHEPPAQLPPNSLGGYVLAVKVL